VAKKLRVDDLDTDHFVSEGYNRDGKLLVTKFFVEDASDIERLKDIGVEICYVDDSVTKANVLDRDVDDENGNRLTAEKILDQEIENLGSMVEKTEKTYQKALDKTQELFESIHEGNREPQELEQLKPYINKFNEFIEDSPTSVSVLTQIERYDKTTFDHSVNVSILSLVYGHYKDFNDEKIMNLGFGALLHDIGKTEVSRQIIQKEGDLTEEEWETVKQHPEEGYDVLTKAGYDEAIRNIALEHHEKPDGSGYPHKKKEIHPLARIVSVVDAYEALTAQRPYREPLNPIKAYGILKDEFYDHDATRNIIESLVHCMGLFPVGCMVELTNGDLAVVLENYPSNLKYPLVKVIKTEASGYLDKPYEIDLAHIQNQKQVRNGRIYDDRVEVSKVLEFSKVPEIREAIPEFIREKQK
jgi:putative nucleotidyltransferase with HDIG domain